MYGLGTLIHFSLPLNPAIHRTDSTPKILCPRCREQEESVPHFLSFYKLAKITLDFISLLINLKCAFNTPFKISLKTTWQLHLNSIMMQSKKFDPQLSQRYCFWIGPLKRKHCEGLESSLLNNNGNLNKQFN